MLVGLDTQILIWGFRDSGSAVGSLDHGKWVRSRVLLRDLADEAEIRIVIPTVMIPELLIPLAVDRHAAFMDEMSKSFLIQSSFSLPACSLAAELWVHHRSLPSCDQTPRRVLKTDILIVAAVKTAGAARFYSHDASCRAVAARAGLDARNLPEHSNSLLTDAEIRQGLEPGGLVDL